MGARVPDSDQGSVRVPEDDDAFESEVTPELLDIARVRGQRVVPVFGNARAGDASRVEDDQLPELVEAPKVPELRGGETGPAGDADERWAVAEALVGKGRTGRGCERLHMRWLS